MKTVLISACLCGIPCRYDGASFSYPEIDALRQRGDIRVLPVCPEVLGGLPTPRVPAERQGERVVNREGRDVGDAYRTGAAAALQTAKENGARLALLKERSPSCGVNLIYDGTFSGKTKAGQGVCAEVLRENGVAVFSEAELPAFLAALAK